jgi:hypothetical protein
MGSTQMTKNVLVEQDLRVNLSPQESTERRKAITELFEMAKSADASQRQFTALRTALTDGKKSRLPDSVQKAVDDLEKKMDSIEKAPAGRGGGEYVPQPVSQRISTLMNAIDGYAFPPTSAQLAEIPRLRTEMTDVDARIKRLIDEDLPALNKLMNDAGVPHISIADQAPAAGGRRR